jgi:HEAT repeat protein
MWRLVIAAIAGIAAAVVVAVYCLPGHRGGSPAQEEGPEKPAVEPSADIEALIKGLRSPNPTDRSIFSRNLVRETGMFFGFKPAALAEEREAAIRRWEEWWVDNCRKTREQWLIDSLSAEGYGGKALALKTLAEMNSTAAVPAIVEILDGEDTDLKFEAIRALGKLKAQKAVPKLIAMLEPGEEPKVRHAAARSLGQIGTQEGLIALEHTAEDADPLTRVEAASALMIRAPGRAAKVLHSLLLDGSAEAKQFAINALASLKKPESVPYLAPLLQAQEPVAAAAHRALFTIVGSDLGRKPDAWLQWYDANMKKDG